MALSKFQEEPIQEFIENLTYNISRKDVDLTFGKIMTTNKMFTTLPELGRKYIPPESSPLGYYIKGNSTNVFKYFD